MKQLNSLDHKAISTLGRCMRESKIFLEWSELKPVLVWWEAAFKPENNEERHKTCLEDVIRRVRLSGPRPTSAAKLHNAEATLLQRFVGQELSFNRALLQMMRLETERVVSMAGGDSISGKSLEQIWDTVGNTPDRDAAIAFATQAVGVMVRDFGRMYGRTDRHLAAKVKRLEQLEAALMEDDNEVEVEE
jgi:hypothetical protein